jgi:hypothetical protein
MSQSTAALHVIPPATITHTVAVIRGDIQSDITVHHAATSDARITLVFGTTLMTLYSAAAAQGLLEAFAATRAAMAQVPRAKSPPPQHRPTSHSPAPPPTTSRSETGSAPQQHPARLSSTTAPASGPTAHRGARRHEIRRPLLWACTAMLLGVHSACVPAAAAPAAPLILQLPAPTGAHPVAVTELHLIDTTRADPWRLDQRRELMVRLWYPTVETALARSHRGWRRARARKRPSTSPITVYRLTPGR